MTLIPGESSHGIVTTSNVMCAYCKEPMISRPGLVLEYNEDGFYHESCRPHPFTTDKPGDPFCMVCGGASKESRHNGGRHPNATELRAADLVKQGYDPIAAPKHYLQTKISPLEVIEDWKLDFHLGSVIKYIGRHLHKGAPLEDLKKAQWYLARKIKLMEET